MSAASGRLHEHQCNSRITKVKRGNYYPLYPGDLVKLDYVIKFIGEIRRYAVSAIDYNNEFAFSHAYSSLSSARSMDFWYEVI